MQLKLAILALSGDSPVSNAFTDWADRLGLSPKGRERKDREEREILSQFVQALHEQTEQFLKRLDQLEQASLEALIENERKQEVARKELERIRDRAYEITMPDGTNAKVYRDGEKVRMESGVEVSPDIVKAEDIGDGHSTWSDYKAADDRDKELAAEHGRIVEFRKQLEQAHKRAGADDLSGDDLTALESRVEKDMPGSVQKHLRSESALPEVPTAGKEPDGLLSGPFRKAHSGMPAGTFSPDPDDEPTPPRPTAAKPGSM